MSIINTNQSKRKIEDERMDTGFCPLRTGAKSPFFEKRISGSVSSHDLVFHVFEHHSGSKNRLQENGGMKLIRNKK